MPRYLIALLLFIVLFQTCRRNTPAVEESPMYRELSTSRVQLPNGWSLTPVGKQVPLGDLPLNLIISPDGKRGLVTNNGHGRHSLMLIDLERDSVLHEREIPKAWYGLAWTGDGKRVYASGANDNVVRYYDVVADSLVEQGFIRLGRPWPDERISVTGLALDEPRKRLYAVTKEDNALYILNLEKNSVDTRLDLPAQGYDCLLAPDGKMLYISLWGGEAVQLYSPVTGRFDGRIPVDNHPNDMVMTKDGKHLFVACSGANSVAVIDVARRKVTETIMATLYPDAPVGSTSNSIALSDDEATLYIANADNNCVAVFDVESPGRSEAKGFIPTGWYPTAVEVVGDKLLVANGKGLTSKANPKGPNPYGNEEGEVQYIGGLFLGTLSIIQVPDAETLGVYTNLVYENSPYNKAKERIAAGEPGNPIPMMVGGESPIKYVFYVIKENRTYDQILGDLPEGNGDPSLCLFPDSVTPNHHALAREFVLLDNFYVNSEVSADGHNWSTAAYANDYVEKTWPTNYSGRGGTYDYEGTREIAYPRDGFIWDFCKRAGISYRTYGEFANLHEAHHKTLVGHTSPRFPSYDLNITDQYRFEQWRIDFDSLLALGQVARFNILRFCNDHTAGAREGMPTPAAMVADNDLALGRFVEHLSKSAIWKESAVFVVEDDAQNGPDHVDAHRSPCLVISPYTKRKHVEHTMYTTASVLRTIELILGLPPMSQYDAAATPMFACFTPKADPQGYTARPNRVDLKALNKPNTRLSMLSYKINLDREDQAPDNLFSEIIWKTVRGEESEMPAPRRSAFLRVVEEEEGDDD